MREIACIGLVLLAAGCGAAERVAEHGPADTGSAATAPRASVLYAANTTVLEDERHGPSLCLGAILQSLPPQCGDVPVTNWDWGGAQGEESFRGTTWGEYHVVGTYEGEAFTIVDVGPPTPDPYAETDDETFVPACEPPSGGWQEGMGRRSDADAGTVEAWASRRPNYVASWVTYLAEPTEASDEVSLPVLYNVIVNEDAASMEAGIRKRWDGPLCVVERDAPPLREARRTRAAAERLLAGLGLQILGSDEGNPAQAARIQVVADPGGSGQAALDDRFGPGLVVVEPVLRPVD